MQKLYLSLLLGFILFPVFTYSQTCATVTASYIVGESRCASNGSIQINATGGSGNYQYKVSGPVITNYTSVSLITGLSAGSYLVYIKDIVSNCVYSNDTVVVPGDYQSPVFSLLSTDVTCTDGNDGTITVIGQNYGRAPFSFIIVAPSASQVGTVSVTGIFTGLIPGNYLIQLSDSCGAIQTRGAAIENYSWSINSSSVTKIGCDSISVIMNLIDSKGNVTPNSIFNLFTYGASKAPGDTTWYSSSSFHYYKANKHRVTLFAKDKCGNIKTVIWNNTSIPTVDANVLISNKACSTFTATVTGQINLTSPAYCIYNSSNVLVTCNSNGIFNNIPYGDYCIKITDTCYDTTINRCLSVARPIPSVSEDVLININCQDFTATVTGQKNLDNANYCLYNNSGVLLYCNSTGIFPNLSFGQYCIEIINNPACSDTTILRCFTITRAFPYVGPNVTIQNITCTTFTAVINDTAHLNNPQFCLYLSPHVLVSCNATGIFDNLPFGTYCVEVVNDPSCFDTTITRCFTVSQPIPSVNNNVTISNRTCTTFTATITGQTNINNPQYCLYDSANVLQSCNTTGEFTNVPLGSYCIKTQNSPACYDTVINRCFTVLPIPVNINLQAIRSCTAIGTSDINVTTNSGVANYSISIYSPTGSLIQTVSTGSSTYTFSGLPNLPSPQQYKVVMTDLCGNKDSASVSPLISFATRVVTVTQKCPSGVLPNGSGDVLIDITNNNIGGDLIPKIIKRNAVTVSINATSSTGYNYTFANLSPATYIFDTYISFCDKHVYDTVKIKFYLFPNLSSSKAYQCDNNGVTVNAIVSGGNAPYLYEIIGSIPASPSIITAPQSSSLFSINNGTIYSLIRLRVVDACSNAGLKDESVLPLANFIVSSDSVECFEHKLTLRVDSIPNTEYTWYKRIPVNDSIVVGTGVSYTITTLLPQDTGRYFCKIVLNSGCLIKFANYVVTGSCGLILPNAITLSGSKVADGNRLYWNTADDGANKYEIERSINNQAVFSKIGTVSASGQNSHNFLDINPVMGSNLYRIKISYAGNIFRYSNVVNVWNTKLNISIYPNPVGNELYVTINSNSAKKYKIETFNMAGQQILSKYASGQDIFTRFPRTPAMGSGLYNLVVTDLGTNEKNFFKVIYR